MNGLGTANAVFGREIIGINQVTHKLSVVQILYFPYNFIIENSNIMHLGLRTVDYLSCHTSLLIIMGFGFESWMVHP